MRNYYFLANELPKIEVDSAPVVSFPELVTLYQENLTKADLKEVNRIRLYYDITNILRLLEGEFLDPRANFSENELKERLSSKEGLPSYVFDFWDRYPTDEERLHAFPSLMSNYFHCEIKEKGVAADCLAFEKGLFLALTGYRAHRMSKPLQEVLEYEDANEEEIVGLLSRKDHSTLALEGDFKELGKALEEAKGEPDLENMAIATFKFDYYSNYQFGHPFSLQFLLPYMMQLMIIEDLYVQNEKLGGLILNSILKDST